MKTRRSAPPPTHHRNKRVAEIGKGLGTLLVFAPADAPLAAFMEGVRRVQETLPTVYVLAE